MHTHLISVDQLKALQASGAPLMVFDCSFDLADPAKRERFLRDGRLDPPGPG